MSAVEYSPETDCLFLLPLLEARPSEVYQILESALHELTLPNDFLNQFPFHRLLKTALEMTQPHWVKLALNWVSDLGPCSADLLPSKARAEKFLLEVETEDTSWADSLELPAT